VGNQAVHASTSSARTAYVDSIGLGEIVEEYVFSIMDSLVIAIKQCKNAKGINASIHLFFWIFLFSNKIANKNVPKYIPSSGL